MQTVINIFAGIGFFVVVAGLAAVCGAVLEILDERLGGRRP